MRGTLLGVLAVLVHTQLLVALAQVTWLELSSLTAPHDALVLPTHI